MPGWLLQSIAWCVVAAGSLCLLALALWLAVEVGLRKALALLGVLRAFMHFLMWRASGKGSPAIERAAIHSALRDLQHALENLRESQPGHIALVPMQTAHDDLARAVGRLP